MSVSITAAQLHAAAPMCPDSNGWADAINLATAAWGIAARRDWMVEFLAQAAHESAQFTRLEEGLSYSAERLVEVWPRRFPTLASAVPYARKPQALADYVYSGRMGNGPIESGDGWRYRGRGLFMVTGRANYTTVAGLLKDSSIIVCPDRLRTKPVAAMASAAWWAQNPELNRLAMDEPNDDDAADFISITRIVNGGLVGLASRQKFRDAFNAVLSPQ